MAGSSVSSVGSASSEMGLELKQCQLSWVSIESWSFLLCDLKLVAKNLTSSS